MEVIERISYDIEKSAERIESILSAGNDSFSDREQVPSRNELDYTNGYYVHVAALFIDIIGSSRLTDEHTPETLAKIYRSYISECIALINGSSLCKEICIHGDCVYGIFDTAQKADIDSVFSIAAGLNSLVRILSDKLRKKGLSGITAGIGMDHGRVLMVKSGNPECGLNNVIWMGDAVNHACHYSEEAGREGRKPMVVSAGVYGNLSRKNQKLLTSYYSSSERTILYEGNAFDAAMEKWYDGHCK